MSKETDSKNSNSQPTQPTQRTETSAPEARSTISIESVTVGFDKKNIVEDVTFEIQPSRILALAGPNGAGKSTLLKAIARQLKLTGGAIKLGGSDIWSLSPSEYASKLAYVAQTPDAQLELTVHEFAMLGRNPHQKWWQWSGSAEDSKIVEESLRQTDMLDLKDKPMSELSGGERQRATIATAIAQQPQFLLLDEPTSHLDYKHQLGLVELLKRQKERGLGIVIVLHDLNLIDALADSAALLKAEPGKASNLQAIGPLAEVMKPEILRDIFEVDVEILTDPDTGRKFFNPLSRPDSD